MVDECGHLLRTTVRPEPCVLLTTIRSGAQWVSRTFRCSSTMPRQADLKAELIFRLKHGVPTSRRKSCVHWHVPGAYVFSRWHMQLKYIFPNWTFCYLTTLPKLPSDNISFDTFGHSRTRISPMCAESAVRGRRLVTHMRRGGGQKSAWSVREDMICAHGRKCIFMCVEKTSWLQCKCDT